MAHLKNKNKKQPRPTTGEVNGRVVARLGPVFTVERLDGGGEVACVARGASKKAVVGDRVRFEEGADTMLASALITAIGPRAGMLVRADALNRRQQVLATHVDHIFIVTAVEPPLRTGLIDRYMVAAHAQSIPASVIFNKTDLVPDAAARAGYVEALSPYPPLGAAVYFTSASSGEGLDALRAALRDQTSIFVGHSGVGKTSLLNALDPGLGARVQALSAASGRGQHTTSASALFKLNGGGEIIDSPGVRGFGLWGIEARQVRDHFAEFIPLQRGCRFADCQHINEPGCAILAALEAKEIAASRHDAYLKIRESLSTPSLGSSHDYFDF
ncbi:ribosome small subunit-dependent GTPase A [Myxococcota bacterium]|nr:ribosome small subunit-dependent GTPase A [Myxococcota bacterium]MBU1429423.1 ribosome small subunit-dependent GTPase A [Myxococcota bacterium]MBU1899391.1 ribosome small subunit-dependent GTPase A [Myxococcota bacterium]